MIDTFADVERLEAVPHWDGDPCACAWCGEAEAAVCIASEPVCATCHTIAYERALIRGRRALRLRAEVAITLRDDAVRERDEMRARAEKVEAERDRLREALQIASDVLNNCTFNTMRIHGQYVDRSEVVSLARAALSNGDGE